MTTDGGLDRWGSNGPVVWHSETASLDYWRTDGIWSDYQSGSEPSTKTYPSDVLLKKAGIENSVPLGILVLRRDSEVGVFGDALLKRLDAYGELNLDILQKALGIEASLQEDILALKQFEVTNDMDSVLQKPNLEKEVDKNLVIKKVGNTQELESDILQKKLGIDDGAEHDIIISRIGQVDIEHDTVMKKLDVEEGISEDVHLKKLGNECGASFDVLHKSLDKEIFADEDIVVLVSGTSDILMSLLGRKSMSGYTLADILISPGFPGAFIAFNLLVLKMNVAVGYGMRGFVRTMDLTTVYFSSIHLSKRASKRRDQKPPYVAPEREKSKVSIEDYNDLL